MSLLVETRLPATERPDDEHEAHQKRPAASALGSGEIRLLLRGVSRCPPHAASVRGTLPNGDARDPTWRGLSGIVHSHGDRVRTMSAGDEVFGVGEIHARHDADGMIVSACDFSRQPAGVSFLDAASLALNGSIAWQMLFKVGRLDRGETVLVLGGETSVGNAAVQLAILHGVRTVAMVSDLAGPIDALKRADRVIDADAGRMEAQCRLAAVVVDTLGGVIYRRARASVRSGCTLVSCVEGCHAPQNANISFFGQPREAGGSLANISELIDAGLLETAPGGIDRSRRARP